MELGFIQTTAPASSLAPLADASTSADSFAQASGAFDAALAQTLQAVEANAGGKGAPAKGAAAPHAWQLTSLFMASTLAAPATPTADGETAPAEESTADAPVEGETPVKTEDPGASPNVVVPVPVMADVKAPVIPQDIAAAGDGSNGQSDPPALDATGAAAAQSDAVRGGQQPAPVAGAIPAGSVTGKQDQPVSTPPSATQPDASMVAGQASADAIRPSADAARTSGESPAPSSGRPVSSDSPRSQATRHVQAVRPEFVDMTTQPTVVQGNAEQAAVPAATIAAAIDSMVASPASGAARESGRAESADSGALLQADITADGLSGNDASMTGDDTSGGQPRPSPEFMRFAAALAQVSPAADDPRGTAPVVAPATSGATATASTAATAAAAPAVPVATPEMPGTENVGRLVQAMRVIARPGAWEATVRLNPEHLGDVSIALRVERNSVSAVVNAEAAGVRQWLESQEQAVRSGMAEHGLNLDRFIVQRDGQRRESDSEQQQESPRRQPRQRQASAQRFEIVV